MIFLSGISSGNINSLLEYIYEGKIEIRKEQLESFLETAKKLKITSLILSVECDGEKVVDNPDNQDLNHEDKIDMKHEEEDYIDGVIESTTKRMLTITKFERKPINKVVEEDAIMESEILQSQFESGSEAIPVTNIENESTNKLAEEDPIHQTGLEEKPYILQNEDEVNAKKDELLYRDRGLIHCRACGKTGPTRGGNNMRKHVEIHMEGLFYKCSKCYKSYR